MTTAAVTPAERGYLGPNADIVTGIDEPAPPCLVGRSVFPRTVNVGEPGGLIGMVGVVEVDGLGRLVAADRQDVMTVKGIVKEADHDRLVLAGHRLKMVQTGRRNDLRRARWTEPGGQKTSGSSIYERSSAGHRDSSEAGCTQRERFFVSGSSSPL